MSKKCGYISEATLKTHAVDNIKADIKPIDHFLFYWFLHTLNNNGSYRLLEIWYII